MADRPFDTPLPADLPEDWTSGQIVAPSGADVGLSQQHGYNYLMEQVNAAQRALNAVNESFDDISGKRTCRFVIGTSTAGWTQADCDYLCDGTDDQVKIAAAINAAPAGGCEIVLLDGEYNWGQDPFVNFSSKNISIVGNPGSTILKISSILRISAYSTAGSCSIFGVTFTSTSTEATASIQTDDVSIAFQRCVFQNVRAYISSGFATEGILSILFNENTMELSSDANLSGGNFNMLYVSTLGSSIPIFFQISGNLLRYNHDLPTSSYAFNVDVEKTHQGAVINNTVLCIGTGGMCQARGKVSLLGNRFSGISVTAGGNGEVFGNTIDGGNLSVVPVDAMAVTGNYINNGRILASNLATICGNVVISSSTGDAAITLQKNAANATVDTNPAISGNFISSEGIGILLKAPSFQFDRESSGALVTGNRIYQSATPIKIESTWSGCMVTDNLFDGSVLDQGTGNIIRNNSDDTGSGGGGTAGVTSFKGRSGAVQPQIGDYTAAMVGAIPATTVASIQTMTQAEYDALTTKDSAALYLIKE